MTGIMNLCRAGTLSSTYTCMPINKINRIIFLNKSFIVSVYLAHLLFSEWPYQDLPVLLFVNFLSQTLAADFENWPKVLPATHKNLCFYLLLLLKRCRSTNPADSCKN